MKMPLADFGAESEKGVVRALDDLFGPSFREVGEYLADKIRLHRYKSMRKILEKAKEISGEVALDPPPVKFLAPFVEASSLEDEDSDLIDMWARLLVDSSRNFQSKHILFMRILKEISGQEANLLKEMVENFRGNRDDFTLNRDIEFAQYAVTDSYVEKFLFDHVGNIEEKDLSTKFIEKFEGAGVYIDSIYFSTGEKNIWPHSDIEGDPHTGMQSRLSREYGFSFEVLRSLGILSLFRSDEIWRNGIGVDVGVWMFTELGAQFYLTCSGEAGEI